MWTLCWLRQRWGRAGRPGHGHLDSKPMVVSSSGGSAAVGKVSPARTPDAHLTETF